MRNVRFTVVPTIALVALSTCTAYAQRWDVTTTYQGKVSITGQADQPWNASGSNISVSNLPVSGTGVKTVTSSGTVKYTYTWNPEASGQPAPTQVYLVESGGANAKIQNNNLSIPPQVIQPTYTATTSSDVPNLVANTTTIGSPTYPSGKEETRSQSRVSWEKVGAGGSFTKTFTISATAGVDYKGNNGLSFATVGLSTGTSIHATPYGWRHTNATPDQGNGQLYFYYVYYSTGGKPSTLTSCYCHEKVVYPGANPFLPPLPFNASMPNPTILPTDPAVQLMTPGWFSDIHSPWPTVQPYSAQTVTATQRYEYDDTFTNETNILVPSDTGETTNTITRSVSRSFTGPSVWYQYVTKSGFTSGIFMP